MTHPLTPTRRVGQVISYSPTPAPTVEVRVADDPTVTHFMPFLDDYFPVVGDYVVLLENQGDYVCLGSPASATPKRAGVTVSYADSFSTDSAAVRNVPGTWTYGETVGGFAAGATTGNGTPIIVPAGADGMYAISHVASMTATGVTGRNFIQLVIGGTMAPTNLRSAYTVGLDQTTSGINGTAATVIPLSAGQTVGAGVFYTSGGSAKTDTGVLTCYRVGS